MAGWTEGLVRDARSVLAVVAHPDDESFGLGALLDTLTRSGVRCGVLCFTRGEASTLHASPEAPGPAGDLAAERSAEFAAAAAVLGLGHTELLGYPDGGLSAVPLAELTGWVLRDARRAAATHLVAFDTGGVTGHPDHARATEAALAAAAVLGIPVLGWTLPDDVADVLNAEFGAAFTGRGRTEIDETLSVDRAGQRRAIRCHTSQSTANPVLWRRLELLGDTEHLRLLSAAGTRENVVNVAQHNRTGTGGRSVARMETNQ